VDMGRYGTVRFYSRGASEIHQNVPVLQKNKPKDENHHGCYCMVLSGNYVLHQ
jgi:hypothetical protein